MRTVDLVIAPARDIKVPRDTQPQVVEAEYVRDLGDPATKDATSSLPRFVVDVVRGKLDAKLHGRVSLSNPAAGSSATVRVLGGSGATRLTRTVVVPPSGDAEKVAWSADDVEAMTVSTPLPEASTATVERGARFVAIDRRAVPFAQAKLHVAPVLVGGEGWKAAKLDVLFRIPTPATVAIEVRQPTWPGFASTDWTATHLATDGTFSASFSAGAGDAWLWWLTGSVFAIGVVLDDLSKPSDRLVAVSLPPLSQTAPGTPTGGGRQVPADPTEAEIANNPGIYSEDPGSFCKPFSNPERVIGERSFHVIVRAEQPVIGPEPSILTHAAEVVDFDPPQELLDVSMGVTKPRGSSLAPSVGLNAAAIDFRNVVDRGTRFTRRELPANYVDWLVHTDRGRAPVDADHPPAWEGDVSRYQAATVARGHILEFRLRWRSNGYSLGTVVKTLTLAPRQVKRIQKIEWNRIERARREERTRVLDRVSDEVERERTYEDEIRASLSEWGRGESESSVGSGAGGFGFAAAGFVIGGGGGHSNASTEASTEAGRRTSAAEEQRLQDAVRRHGEALRQIESIVVNEVTQEETITGSSEIVRNINYSHAITVVYYQILRHLRVETDFAAVRECLFVPFAVKPFTTARAYRWRELIQRGLRDRKYLSSVRYLRDVLTNFESSSIPPGRRSDQPIRQIQGSIFVRLAIERPADLPDGKFDDEAWAVVRSLIGMPAMGIQSRVQELLAIDRERVFQAEHAPRIAAAWLDALTLSASGQLLPADFTLATRYVFNSVARVDFTVGVGDGPTVTRELLRALRITATKDLPPGSVANVERLTFTYQTDQFRRAVDIDQGAGDLVIVETGESDAQGATLTAPPDTWERRDLRAEIVRSVNDLVRHLNEHVEHYHKVIWWNMDRDRLFMLLDGFFVPGLPGVSIASVVERDPIAIIGNALVFRVSSGAFLGIDKIQSPAALYDYYADRQLPRDPLHISLPTDGLYAQTLMDECNALEEHFGNTDWVLTDKEPDLADLPPELLATRRAETAGATPTPFGPTIITLPTTPDAPPPQGVAGVLAAITNPEAFRDLTGIAGTQANARAGLETAAGLASSFGAQAAALKLAEMASKERATQMADQKLASIERAVGKDLLTQGSAERHATKVLDSLHESSTTARPHQDSPLAEAIRRAIGQPGSDIQAGTPEGQVRVQLASLDSIAAQIAAAATATAPPPPSRIDGIDLHHLHPLPGISDLRADGIEFAILKATQGRTFVDSEYATRHTTAFTERFIVGGYHFWDSTNSSDDQADNMIAAIGRIVPGDLPPAMDFEGKGLETANLQGNDLLAPMETFLDRVETAFGRSPMIYTSRVVWRDWIHDEPAFQRFGDYPLWVKQYFLPKSRRFERRLTRNPALPAPWMDWAIWQYSGDFTPTEYTNLHDADPVTDANVSNGGIHVLRGLADIGRPCVFGDTPRYVVYTDESGTLWMLIFIGFWMERNLTTDLVDLTTGVGPLAAGDVAGVEHNGTRYIAFRGRSDNHIIESDLTTTLDLTTTVGGRPAINDPAYLAVGADRYLLYRGDDDHHYLLKNSSGTWTITDVTAAATLQPVSGTATIYALGNEVHIVGRTGADGRAIDVFHDGAQWNPVNVVAVNAPPATYQPAVYLSPSTAQHIVYRGLRGSIHQTDRQANDVDLTLQSGGAPTCAGNPAAFAIGGNGHVVYRRADGQLHEIFFDGSQWRHRQLPCLGRAAADPFAYASTQGQQEVGIVVFRDRTGLFHQLTLNGGQWMCEEIEPQRNEPPEDEDSGADAGAGDAEGEDDSGTEDDGTIFV